MQRIPYRDLPDFSDLYCDYVDGVTAVAPFFNGNPRNVDDVGAQLERVMARSFPREQLADILTAQNKIFHAGNKSFENIGLLRKPSTVAVVTGQQVGLLGGPLYTIYKTLTAIKLCKDLRKLHRNVNFIPVFWLETEDHDFAEANHATVLDAAGTPVTISYAPAAPVDETSPNRGAVGALKFDDSIDAAVALMESTLSKSDFHDDLVRLIRSCYKPGADFGTAFGTLMQALFPEAGLVLVNPLDPEIKKLLIPVFRKELDSSPRVSEAIISQTAMIEDRYHAQVKARTINLFMLWKNGRYGIDPRRDRGDYWLKGTRQYFTKDDLHAMLENEPERFSPNVVLRPICQDYLFPTVCYVGGPGEVAYFAQFKTAYGVFDMSMPVIYPRASVTLVENKFAVQLEKLGMGLAEYLSNPHAALEKSVQAQSAINLNAVFEQRRGEIDSAFEGMRTAVESIDKTLGGALTNAREKSIQAFDLLAKKTLDAAVRSNETATRQMDKLKSAVYPNEELQERTLNIFTYLNKYSMEFLTTIAERISVDSFTHQALTINGAVKKVEDVQQSLEL